MRNKLLTFGLLILTGCIPQPVQVKVVPVKKPPLIIPSPPPLSLEDVKFGVQVIDGGTMFALAPEDYKRLTENVKKVTEYIKLQQTVIDQYKAYYESNK